MVAISMNVSLLVLHCDIMKHCISVCVLKEINIACCVHCFQDVPYPYTAVLCVAVYIHRSMLVSYS